MSVPRLRFKDVNEREFPEWDERPITDCLQLMTDFVANGSFESLKKNVVVYSENEYAYYVRLYDLRLRLGHLNQTYVDETSYKFLKKSFLKSGDILVANIGANAGEVWQVPLLNKPATIAPNMILLKVSKSTNESYLYYYLKSEYGEERIKNTIGGSGQPKVSKTELKTIKVKVPASLSEQTKIANFLTAIDEKISQLTQKYDLLKQYKKGVMQQIFSQKLRFKDEDGREFSEWEEKKLKDVFTIKYGKDYKHLEEGNIPLLGTGGVMKYVNQHLYDKPSVLIGRKGTIDKPQFIQIPFWTVDTLFYTEIDECYSPYFVYLLVSQVDWYKYNEATGVPSLNTAAINNVDVRLPSDIKEQTKIANFFTAIDDKITHTLTQLDAVKLYKKGLLQQMFV